VDFIGKELDKVPDTTNPALAATRGSPEDVREAFARHGLLDKNVHLLQVRPPDPFVTHGNVSLRRSCSQASNSPFSADTRGLFSQPRVEQIRPHSSSSAF
jgi:hypothetical protein